MIVNTLKVRGDGFPELLLHVDPRVDRIFWSGRHPSAWLNSPKVSIVGSRKISAYGKRVTDKVATELAKAGVVIISGLAYGVDITAHKAALAVGGVTVAVLPSSLDSIYPAAHYNIANQIIENGTLISEYDQGEGIAFKSNFIARNRIVSGLADVLVITEAAVNSGSLHTARFAIEQGKTVMVVPGNITSPTSEGCNNLIKSGALPLTDVSDVFFALKISPEKKKKAIKFTGTQEEKLIFELIKQGVCAQDELALVTDSTSAALSSTLTMLEIYGYIRPLGSGNWALA
jgi:DNA processing protein